MRKGHLIWPVYNAITIKGENLCEQDFFNTMLLMTVT